MKIKDVILELWTKTGYLKDSWPRKYMSSNRPYPTGKQAKQRQIQKL